MTTSDCKEYLRRREKDFERIMRRLKFFHDKYNDDQGTENEREYNYWRRINNPVYHEVVKEAELIVLSMDEVRLELWQKERPALWNIR